MTLLKLLVALLVYKLISVTLTVVETTSLFLQMPGINVLLGKSYVFRLVIIGSDFTQDYSISSLVRSVGLSI